MLVEGAICPYPEKQIRKICKSIPLTLFDVVLKYMNGNICEYFYTYGDALKFLYTWD